MLNVMRDNLKHLKWVLWLVAFAMVFYLGAFFSCDDGRGQGGSAPWAARVDSATISVDEFRSAAQNLDNYYRQLFDASYDQLKPQLQIGSLALESLIEREVILLDAGRLGLSATPEEIARSIRTDPNFADPTGQFIGNERYAQLVRRAFGGPEAYERLVADQLVVDKWDDLIAQAVSVSDADLEALHRERTEKTAIDYVMAEAGAQQIDDVFDDTELRDWYDAHSEDYMRAEGRMIRYLVIEREKQAEQIEVGTDDVQAFYESNQANYSHPDQRGARHILFRLEPGADDAAKAAARARAEEALARLRAGEDFAELATALSEDPTSGPRGGDLGFFGRGQMVPAFEEVAFSTPVGELAPVVESEFGFHVIEVTGERAAGVLPLTEVEEAIRRTLRLRLAQERVTQVAERLRENLGRTEIEQVAEQEGLIVEERFVSRGERLVDLGAAPDFVDAVLALDNGGVSEPLRVARGLAVAVAGELVPESVKPFDEATDAVRDDLRAARALEAARAAAHRAFAEEDFDAAVKTLGLEVKESGDLGPAQTVPGTGSSPRELAPHLFGPEVAEGRTGLVDVPAGALIYRVSRREAFDPASFLAAKADLREELLQQRRNVWRQTVLTRLREGHEILRNTDLVARIDGS